MCILYKNEYKFRACPPGAGGKLLDGGASEMGVNLSNIKLQVERIHRDIEQLRLNLTKLELSPYHEKKAQRETEQKIRVITENEHQDRAFNEFKELAVKWRVDASLEEKLQYWCSETGKERKELIRYVGGGYAKRQFE
jgi:hypothetical protein